MPANNNPDVYATISEALSLLRAAARTVTGQPASTLLANADRHLEDALTMMTQPPDQDTDPGCDLTDLGW
ncbi:MAG: hypothetical protein FWF28_09435 [Micrococcales bacterium]|nr:hypothetical protein [Micrococcales bacterium]